MYAKKAYRLHLENIKLNWIAKWTGYYTAGHSILRLEILLPTNRRTLFSRALSQQYNKKIKYVYVWNMIDWIEDFRYIERDLDGMVVISNGKPVIAVSLFSFSPDDALPYSPRPMPGRAFHFMGTNVESLSAAAGACQTNGTLFSQIRTYTPTHRKPLSLLPKSFGR